jgi:uncharacterized RDD family membrane protein YckC
MSLPSKKGARLDQAQQSGQDFIEGIRIRTSPAPLLKRTFAAVIDVAIVTAAFYVAFFVLLFLAGILGVAFVTINSVLQGGMNSAGVIFGVILLVLAMLVMMSGWHIYFIYFEYKRGATPGKKMMGLRVVSADGGPITKGQAIYRDFVRWYIDGLFILPAIISIACTKKRQRVGDLLADTMVVHSKLSEDRQRFMYVKREDYMALLEHVQPKPVAADVREKYLEFASHVLLVGAPNEALQADWVKWIRAHLERTEALGINDYTILRFFAEYCFQEELKAKEGTSADGRTK